MNWVGLLGSLGGVLALAAVAWWLGLGRSEPLTAEEVLERAEFEFGPMAARLAFVGEDGAAAVVIVSDGRAILFKKHGTQPASRMVLPPVAWDDAEGGLLFRTGDRRFGDVRLRVAKAERDRLIGLL